MSQDYDHTEEYRHQLEIGLDFVARSQFALSNYLGNPTEEHKAKLLELLTQYRECVEAGWLDTVKAGVN